MVSAPINSFVPDVLRDASGTVHMVYAWTRTPSTSSRTMRVNPGRSRCESIPKARSSSRWASGPKLARGSDGALHVVWTDCWSPGIQTLVRYARSWDGGKSFGPRQTLSSTSGNDGITVAADRAGHVIAFWHVMNPPQKEVPQATWLRHGAVYDGGVSWRHDEPMQISNLSALACSMCLMRARCGDDGRVYVAFRSAEGNLRDFFVLASPVTENAFTAVRVNQDNWKIKTCPMCGPELTIAPDGRQICAFMSRHRVFWAESDARVSAFQGHAETPSPEDDEIYPTAVANRAGDVLLVWQVGPMSTTGTATVKWAIYDRDGKWVGRKGTIGQTTSGTKATAFVDGADSFRIVTTAR